MDANFDLIREGLFLFCFVFACSFMYIITSFYCFHINLVLTNTTTLEHLEHEKERDPERKPNLGKVAAAHASTMSASTTTGSRCTAPTTCSGSSR